MAAASDDRGGQVEVGDGGVVRVGEGAEFLDVPVDAPVEFTTITPSDGPFGDDLFWRLRTEDLEIAIPGSWDGCDALRDALSRLPGLNFEAVFPRWRLAESGP